MACSSFVLLQFVDYILLVMMDLSGVSSYKLHHVLPYYFFHILAHRLLLFYLGGWLRDFVRLL